jgi:hypothetical protein
MEDNDGCQLRLHVEIELIGAQEPHHDVSLWEAVVMDSMGT